MSDRTYVMGTQAVYDPILLDSMTDILVTLGITRLQNYYLRTWRILHIDGFENYPSLPACAHKPIHFCWSSSSSKTSSFSGIKLDT